MDNDIMTYEQFIKLETNLMPNGNKEWLWLHEDNMDVGGGNISKDDIDKLNQYPKTDHIIISGLSQENFEYFMKTYGHQIRYLYFFKNKFIQDLSILGDYPKIKYIQFFFNQRVNKLWDMTQNLKLVGLVLDDFSKLYRLDGIEKAPMLKYLSFGNKVWSKSSLLNIDCLKKCYSLEAFHFSGKIITSISIDQFLDIPHLCFLDFPTNMFATEDVARLVAKAPHLKGYSLRPYIKFVRQNSEKDILIVGKRKPFLHSINNQEKIQKYAYDFNKMVNEFKKILQN